MTRDQAWLHVAILLLATSFTFWSTFSLAATMWALCLEHTWIVWVAFNERWPGFGHAVRRELGMTTNNINQGR